MKYDKELAVASAAVRKASALCLEVMNQSSISSVEKEDHSPVSVADLGSQAVATMELLESFPNDPVVGEEEADTLRKHESLRKKVLALVRKQNGPMEEEALLEEHYPVFRTIADALRPVQQSKHE